MANEIRQKVGTQILFADHAGDFAATAANNLEQGTPVDVQLTLASLAAGRQSARFDFGATRARAYSIMAALEFAATPVAGSVVRFYLAPSPDPTGTDGNPGGVGASDAAYAGYSSNLEASLLQLLPIGTFVATAQATGTVQVAHCGTFVPPERYGALIVVCDANTDLHSDDVESHIVFNPIVDEVQ